MQLRLLVSALLVVSGCSHESASGILPWHHFRKVDPELGMQFLAIYLSPDEVSLTRDNPPEVGTAPLEHEDLDILGSLFSDERMAAYQRDSTLGKEGEDVAFTPPPLTPPTQEGADTVATSDCECEPKPCPCAPETSNETPDEVRYYVNSSGGGLMIFSDTHSAETAQMLRAHEDMYDRYHEAVFGRPFER